MRRFQPRLAAVAVLAALTVVAGCGGSSPSVPKDPKGELKASVTNLGDTDVLTATFSLDTTPEALRAYARSQGSKLTAVDAAAIASAQFVLEASNSSGKSFADSGGDKKTNVALRASVNGKALIEFRFVDGDLYLRGDVPGILAVIHQSKALKEVQARAATLPTFVQAAVNGQWVSIDGAAAKGLASSFGGAQTPNADASKQLLDQLQQIFSTDVTVTKAGSDGDGDHLVLTGDTRQLATDFLHAVSGVVPAGQAALGQVDPSRVPSRQLTVDAWVKDGVLSKLSLDIAQFQDGAKAGASLPIVLSFAQSGDDIGKPSDVTPVDLTKLGSLLGVLGGM